MILEVKKLPVTEICQQTKYKQAQKKNRTFKGYTLNQKRNVPKRRLSKKERVIVMLLTTTRFSSIEFNSGDLTNKKFLIPNSQFMHHKSY
jgi:hypothetical protein